MDSYREHPRDFELPAAEEVPPHQIGLEIGTDERRMHVRAYNYWVSLLEGRDYPSIEDLEPADIQDFAPNSVLLDFTSAGEEPAAAYIGAAIREECGLDHDIASIAEVPSRSLLSRLTDHYLQIIANRAPIGFEAEFVNQRGLPICYRGILMPFSSDGDTIDFIYGVINWKQTAEARPLDVFKQAPEPELAMEPDAEEADAALPPPAPVHFSPQRAGPDRDLAAIMLDEDAGLADWLGAARESAEAVRAAEGRSRAALYRALSMAYDFALASVTEPEAYAELLDESGVKAQSRAPMTPVVKLVFGIDYDKTRLTEFAAALSWAKRQHVEIGGFLDFIDKQPGGLKALVAAEREARRPGPRADTRGETARRRLRQAPPLALGDIVAGSEFTLVLARRSASGGVEAIALVEDESMIERAIRRAAG